MPERENIITIKIKIIEYRTRRIKAHEIYYTMVACRYYVYNIPRYMYLLRHCVVTYLSYT